MVKPFQAHRRAYFRAAMKVGFYYHLAAYVAVNLLLVFINYATTPNYLWYKWSVFGWGIGLFFHWLRVFMVPTWTQHFVDQELDDKNPGK